MDEVTKGMSNRSEGPITTQGHQTSQKNVDEDLVESTTEDTAASILSHLGDILFSHGQISPSGTRARPGGSKTPDTITPSHKYDITHGSVNSPIPQKEVTFPVLSTKTTSNVKSQPRTEWQPSRLFHHGSLESNNQFALLVLNQPIENKNILRVVWKKGELI
jgi:hypothetical protein